MKKIKLILIIMVMLLLSGCEANYSLYIDKDVFNETTTVLANSGELNTYDSQTYLTMKQKIDLYYKKYVDIVYQNPYYNPYLDDPQKGINYYNKELINNGKGYGFKYSYNFNKENYLNSNIINTFFKNNNSVLNDNKYILDVYTFNGFERYNDLTQVTINITTDLEVKKSNADSVYNNVYTWTITKDDALNKKIYLELVNINKLDKKTENKIIIIIISLIFIVGLLLYAILNKKRLKNNSI